MALPTFEEFRKKLCDECDCTYEETRVESPPGSKKYITGGAFKRKGKVAVFMVDNIGPHLDEETICSILGRLTGLDPVALFGVKCRKR